MKRLFYRARKRAALAWDEVNTLIAGDGIDGSQFEATREHFSEKGIADLILAISPGTT